MSGVVLTDLSPQRALPDGGWPRIVRDMRAGWLLLVCAMTSNCEGPPGPCSQGVPVPASLAKLDCSSAQPPALAYAEGGILSLVNGRASRVQFDPAASQVVVHAGSDDYPVVLPEPDVSGYGEHLAVAGGPCASDCEVSPSMFLAGAPSRTLTVQLSDGGLADWNEVLVFGGASRVCVEAGGVMMLPAGALFLQFNGKSSDSQVENGIWWMGFRNAEPARLRVDFEARRLEVSAELCEAGGTNWGLSVTAQGQITDIPPVAVTAGRVELDCTSPAGAEVTLDASHSYDLDGDSLTYSWWKNGVGWGNELVRPLTSDPRATVTAPPGTTTYWVSVMQNLFSSSQAPLEVVVRPNQTCPATDGG